MLRRWLIGLDLHTIFACKTPHLERQGKTDKVRYQHLDAQKARIAAARAANPRPTFETRLAAKVNAFGGEETLSWIYGNDIEKVWNEFLAQESATPQNGVKKYT